MQFLIGYLVLGFISLLAFRGDTASVASASPPMNGIQTNSDFSTESLVRDIFAKGACNNISNIRAIGNRAGIGYFENGSNTIGMKNGIIIATGQVDHAEGPNQVGDKSGNLGNTSGDPDLGMFVDERVLDVVGIEFDFVPLDSFVTFRYVFASEEYCEFVGSVYNDVFGFFVSGPGIEGAFSNHAKNVALIPGTNDYVAINSVNHAYNSQYFIRNELERDSRQCNIPPFLSPYRNNIEYDGFTTILTANLHLIPCETYHIRFVVADVADRFYDSAVFLEAESFNIGGTVGLDAVAQNANQATEGCQDAFFVFRRSDQENHDNPLTVQFKIADESTAIEGVDFAPIPRKITIPAGQMQAKLPIQIFNDGNAETNEKLSIELDIPCACYSGEATLLITDPSEMQVRLPDATTCRSNTTILQPEVSGGIPPYSYHWSNGASTPELHIAPDNATTYAVTVSDQCGNSAIDSCVISIIEPPGASLSGTADICAGDTAYLSMTFSGTAPWNLIYTLNGTLQTPIENITTSDFQLPVFQDGTYRIQSVTDAVCTGSGEGVGQLNITTIDASAKIQPISCTGKNDGNIELTPSGGHPPYDFNWSIHAENSAVVHELAAGDYAVTITDTQGCKGSFHFVVPEPPPLAPVVYKCEDLTNPDFTFNATGGTPPYLYAVDGANFMDNHIFKQLPPGGTYHLTIRDANGCELQQSFALPPKYERMVELPAVLKIKIGETFELQPKLNIPKTLVANIRWLPTEYLSCLDCLNPLVEGLQESSYTVRVTDVLGCTGEATVQIRLDHNVDVFIPSAFSPDGDGVNDRFTVYANERQVRRVLSFQVFDRWGNRVFAAEDFLPNDESKGWDGQIGKLLPNAGTFVYFATLKLTDGTEVIRKGQVLLVR